MLVSSHCEETGRSPALTGIINFNKPHPPVLITLLDGRINEYIHIYEFYRGHIKGHVCRVQGRRGTRLVAAAPAELRGQPTAPSTACDHLRGRDVRDLLAATGGGMGEVSERASERAPAACPHGLCAYGGRELSRIACTTDFGRGDVRASRRLDKAYRRCAGPDLQAACVLPRERP